MLLSSYGMNVTDQMASCPKHVIITDYYPIHQGRIGYATLSGNVFLSPKADKYVLIHELAHCVDFKNRTIRKEMMKELGFYDKETFAQYTEMCYFQRLENVSLFEDDIVCQFLTRNDMIYRGD